MSGNQGFQLHGKDSTTRRNFPRTDNLPGERRPGEFLTREMFDRGWGSASNLVRELPSEDTRFFSVKEVQFGPCKPIRRKGKWRRTRKRRERLRARPVPRREKNRRSLGGSDRSWSGKRIPHFRLRKNNRKKFLIRPRANQ